MERDLRERKLLAVSTGPAVAAMLVILPFLGPIVAASLAGAAFALTYYVSRERLTTRLLSGASN